MPCKADMFSTEKKNFNLASSQVESSWDKVTVILLMFHFSSHIYQLTCHNYYMHVHFIPASFCMGITSLNGH
jgi:hypothetical protein